MAVFYVQAAFMLKSWPTHNRKSYSAMASVATHLLAALIIFYDGPCAIKYVHRGNTAGCSVLEEGFYLYKFTYAVTVDAGRDNTYTHIWHYINIVFVSGNF